LLVAGFHSGGGDERFLARHFAADRQPLKIGSQLADTVRHQQADDRLSDGPPGAPTPRAGVQRSPEAQIGERW